MFFIFNGLSGDDDKGNFVLLQMPLALQMAILDAIGFGWFLEKLSWVSAYFLIGGGTAWVLFLCGHFFKGDTTVGSAK